MSEREVDERVSEGLKERVEVFPLFQTTYSSLKTGPLTMHDASATYALP